MDQLDQGLHLVNLAYLDNRKILDLLLYPVDLGLHLNLLNLVNLLDLVLLKDLGILKDLVDLVGMLLVDQEVLAEDLVDLQTLDNLVNLKDLGNLVVQEGLVGMHLVDQDYPEYLLYLHLLVYLDLL